MLFRQTLRLIAFALPCFAVATAEHAGTAKADALPDGRSVAENVNARDDGRYVSRQMVMQLIDSGGSTRERTTRSFRTYDGADKKIAIYFEQPRNVRDTAFLTFDYAEAGEQDDQLLYLPALRKVRRISGSDRGDYFMGTDFTYDDMKLDGKIALGDYDFQSVGRDAADGVPCLVLEATTKNDSVAQELGYSRTVSCVDEGIWIARRPQRGREGQCPRRRPIRLSSVGHAVDRLGRQHPRAHHPLLPHLRGR
ncbi:MAG: outer membrane lipoprotein-sorting protein [Cytophagales bacterium]|nr:outer membrane lipoprotein-sorting protein [Cytophagales bacterium]